MKKISGERGVLKAKIRIPERRGLFCFQTANILVANSRVCATLSSIAEFSEDQKINRAITPGRVQRQEPDNTGQEEEQAGHICTCIFSVHHWGCATDEARGIRWPDVTEIGGLGFRGEKDLILPREETASHLDVAARAPSLGS